VAVLLANSVDAVANDTAVAAAVRDIGLGPAADRAAIDRRHPLSGADALARAGAAPAVGAAVAVHHERLDGSGFPIGLAGDAIGSAGRAVGVADAFVAMIRPSAASLSIDPAGAFRVLRFATRGRFDERAVVALADLIAEGTIGGREAARSN
jgi:HD-GYP domain-containing protein (c-di-GMP phosphodiesterase class II)